SFSELCRAYRKWYNQRMRKALTILAMASFAWGADSRPKVRAITAFVNIDPKQYTSQYDDTMKFLNSAREAYKTAGFEVETVRIVTQPYTRYTNGMKRDEALTFLSKLNDLSAKLGFSPNIGSAMQ